MLIKVSNHFKIAMLVLLLAFFCVTVAADIPTKQESAQERVTRIYNQLVNKTGLGGLVPPIYVIDLPIDNAYNTGQGIFIYQGIIDLTDNDDELALIIGHEMSHSTLMHFGLNPNDDPNLQQVLESQADKMGAFYILRAGYDVCKAREIWKKFDDKYGDTLGEDHPPVAYRYDQLNIGCDDNVQQPTFFAPYF